jgi:hypothetical protein
MNAGVDVETPDGEAYLLLPELVREGRVTEAQIDAAVRRILRMKFDAGPVRESLCRRGRGRPADATPDAIALAREAAAGDGAARNEGNVLPLDASRIRRMAVLGTHARDTPIGGYSDVPRHVVSVLEGLQEEARASSRSTMPRACGSPRRGSGRRTRSSWCPSRSTAADRRGGRDRAARRRHRAWCSATTSRPAARPGPTIISATARRST